MNLKQKGKTAAIIVAVLLMVSMMLFASQVQAQEGAHGGAPEGTPGGSIPLPPGVTPDNTKEARAFLSFTPNPIGVGQPLLVNLFMSPQLHVSRYFSDFKVTITKPDGEKEITTIDSYNGDATAWFEYVVDQPGEWKLKFDFPGGYFPAGNYTIPSTAWSGAGSGQVYFAQSVYYLPSSSPEQTLIVQNDMVYSWPPAPLPSDYWDRPISLENREWWPIAGNYPGTGYVGGGSLWDELYPGTNPHWSDRYAFTPWVQGPNTSHIVWKRQGAVAGLIGGQAGQYAVLGTPSTPSLIYSGRVYQTYTKPGVGSVAACYDLRTGQVYYEIPTATGGVTPTVISYISPDRQTLGTGAAPGAEVQTSWLPELLAISNGYLMKVNPYTGALSLNVSIAPLTGSGGTYYMNTYVLAVQNLGTSVPVAQRYRLINWTTAGSTTNFTQRIISNSSYALSSLPTFIDYNVGIGVNTANVMLNATGVAEFMQIVAYDLTTGQLRWNITVHETGFNGLANIADHGKVAVMGLGGYYLAYDLYTGKLAWKSETMEYPWAEASFGSYNVFSAYGKLFWPTYAGVYAFDWDTGKIAWKYEAPALAAFESPYINSEGNAIYPFMDMSGSRIADGKLYVYNNEHSTSSPHPRGWGLHCINITTGEAIWRITDYVGYGAPVAIADGYLTSANSRDGYMYVFGKGKSATTVSTPDVIVTNGTGVLIKGTVLDMSPGQPNTPCVSKESMTTQMEYLHMQYPIDGIWHNETITGVPVVLTAIDSKGSVTDIGTTTTNGYGGTFGISWTPPKEDTYTIMASFAGTDSYGNSMATTALSVGPAPAAPTPTPTEQPQAAPDNTSTIVGMGIAIIIAVAIVGVMLYRKRP
jgi:hypothetical protein